LADRTIGRAIGTLCRLSVCLSSVTFCIVAKRYVLAKIYLKERMGNHGRKVDFFWIAAIFVLPVPPLRPPRRPFLPYFCPYSPVVGHPSNSWASCIELWQPQAGLDKHTLIRTQNIRACERFYCASIFKVH